MFGSPQITISLNFYHHLRHVFAIFINQFFFSIANQFYAKVAFVEMLISISYIYFFVLDDL